MSAAGLCYADEDKEVSLVKYRDESTDEKTPVQTYHGDNMVCVDDKVYLFQGAIYEIELSEDSYRKSSVWLSTEEMQDMNFAIQNEEFTGKDCLYSAGNLQYSDGYIYFSKEVVISGIKKGQAPTADKRFGLIGQVNTETKSVEIIKIIDETITGGPEYVVCDGWLYYTCGELENLTLRKCRLDGSDDQLLYEGYSYNLNIYKDKLYFLGESTNQISSMNLDGSNRKTLVDAGEYISVFTIDPEGNAIYYTTGDSVHKLSLDDLGVSKVMSVCGRPYYMTCVDSKLYMSFGMPIRGYTDKGYTNQYDSISAQCGTKDKPLLTGLCYDTERKTARVAYTYLDGETIFTGTQRYFWKNYSGEEYGLYQAINSSVIFEIYTWWRSSHNRL